MPAESERIICIAHRQNAYLRKPLVSPDSRSMPTVTLSAGRRQFAGQFAPSVEH